MIRNSLPTLLALLVGCDDAPKRGDGDTVDTEDTSSADDGGHWDRPRDGEPDFGTGGGDGGTETTPITERRHDCQGMDPADAAPLGGYIALTFDDGPRAETTPQILDVLRRHEVPATFFVLGDRLDDPTTWDIADDILADPLFDLANHSTTHPPMTDLSLSEVADEVDITTAMIEDFGGAPAFFRFPYGLSDCDRADLVRDRGYRVTGWHIDTGDWCYAVGVTGECTPDDYWRIPEEYSADMLAFTMEQLLRFDGGVVLLHDIHQFTADAVEDIILSARAEGFTFVDLDDADAFPDLNAGTPHDFPWQGEACSTADDQCWQVEYAAWCEPTSPGEPGATDGICTVPCEGYCLDRSGAATTFCAAPAAGDSGQCTGYAEEINTWCEALPGADQVDMERFVGTSGASEYTASVCAPEHWLD